MSDDDIDVAPEIAVEAVEVDDKVEPATIDDLLGKGRTHRVVTLVVGGQRKSLRFEPIPGDGYDQLERQHKPEPADLGLNGRSLMWNPRTFPPALVAASLVDPVLSEADVRRIWSSPDWSKGDRTLLFNAAFDVNNASDLVDLGKGLLPTP